MGGSKKKLFVPTRLKALRSREGLSLSDVQAATGVSKAMLWQIEQGESSPTLETLWKLSTGLRKPLTAIVGGLGQSEQRLSKAPTLDVVAHEGISIRTVFPFSPTLCSETLLVTLSAGKCQNSDAHALGVMEDVFVLDGNLEISLRDLQQRLTTNESVRFNADEPHSYMNTGDGETVFLNTIHYPES